MKSDILVPFKEFSYDTLEYYFVDGRVLDGAVIVQIVRPGTQKNVLHYTERKFISWVLSNSQLYTEVHVA